jgi:integrase
MSLFRYKGSTVWTMEFMFHGQRIRETTGTRSKTLAQKVEGKRRRELEEGSAGIRKQQTPKLFSLDAQIWLDIKSVSLAPSSVKIASGSLRHLLPMFGKQLSSDIEASDVARYQKKRLESGAAPKSVNLEVGTLRAILKKSGHWARIQPDIKMLKVNQDIGRAISAEEEAALLQACSTSRCRMLVPFVTLAIETGARYGIIRTLLWGNVDFANRCLKWGKDKTTAGTGRIVPLNQRAITVLKFWATNFPHREPGHFVFGTENYGGAGDKLTAITFGSDPTEPVGSIKEAWEFAKVRAARILAGKPDSKEKIAPLPCRFHDLRHTAITRMRNRGVPLEKIAKIVGWSTSQMVRMAAIYGHYTLDDLREAVEGGSARSPVNSPAEAGEIVDGLPN